MVIKLHGIGNLEKFNYYVFDKKQEVAEELAKLFEKIFNLRWEFVDFSEKKQEKRNIEEYKDKHESLTHNRLSHRIDIFYGNRKMFMTVYCPKRLRTKFNKELEASTIMPEPKKLQGEFFKEKKGKKRKRKKHGK